MSNSTTYLEDRAGPDGHINVGTKPLVSDQNSDLVYLINYVVLSSGIGLFGIGSNIINIIIFTKHKFQEAMNVSLLGLSISDLIGLLFLQWSNVCMNPFFFNSDLVPFFPPEFQYFIGGWPHVCFSRITLLITVFVAVERCLCITMPLRVKRMLTPRRSFIVIICIYTVMIMTLIPAYVTINIDWKFIPKRNLTLLGLLLSTDKNSFESISLILNLVMQVLFFFAIISANAMLVYELHKKTRWRQEAITESLRTDRNTTVAPERTSVVPDRSAAVHTSVTLAEHGDQNFKPPLLVKPKPLPSPVEVIVESDQSRSDLAPRTKIVIVKEATAVLEDIEEDSRTHSDSERVSGAPCVSRDHSCGWSHIAEKAANVSPGKGEDNCSVARAAELLDHTVDKLTSRSRLTPSPDITTEVEPMKTSKDGLGHRKTVNICGDVVKLDEAASTGSSNDDLGGCDDNDDGRKGSVYEDCDDAAYKGVSDDTRNGVMKGATSETNYSANGYVYDGGGVSTSNGDSGGPVCNGSGNNTMPDAGSSNARSGTRVGTSVLRARNRDRRLSRMILFLSTILFVCYLPSTVCIILMLVEPKFSVTGDYVNAFFVGWSFAWVSDAINSSVNIFVYYNMSSKYRATFNKMFRSCFKVGGKVAPDATRQGSHTNHYAGEESCTIVPPTKNGRAMSVNLPSTSGIRFLSPWYQSKSRASDAEHVTDARSTSMFLLTPKRGKRC